MLSENSARQSNHGEKKGEGGRSGWWRQQKGEQAFYFVQIGNWNFSQEKKKFSTIGKVFCIFSRKNTRKKYKVNEIGFVGYKLYGNLYSLGFTVYLYDTALHYYES